MALALELSRVLAAACGAAAAAVVMVVVQQIGQTAPDGGEFPAGGFSVTGNAVGGRHGGRPPHQQRVEA